MSRKASARRARSTATPGAPAAAGLARLVAAVEAAPEPSTALQRIAALRSAIDDAERHEVIRALGAGASLASVGRDLGISRQAVHRRYGELQAPSRGAPRRERPAPGGAGVELTAEARLVLRRALAEAKAAGDPVLGGEHVLLALLQEPDLPALQRAGVTLERARSQVLAASSGAGVFKRAGEPPDSRSLLLAAATTAAASGRARITPELLLFSALADPDAAAARTLRAIGADPDAVRTALRDDAASHDRPE